MQEKDGMRMSDIDYEDFLERFMKSKNVGVMVKAPHDVEIKVNRLRDIAKDKDYPLKVTKARGEVFVVRTDKTRDIEGTAIIEQKFCPVCGQPDNCGDCTHERLGSTISNYDRENVGHILQGHGSWFSADLLRLIAKSDRGNREAIRIVYPDHVEAYEKWMRGEVEDGK